jgi:hypothetical protein
MGLPSYSVLDQGNNGPRCRQANVCVGGPVPDSTLRADKKAAIARNKLSIFTREMECRLISAETAQFRPMWLNIREPGIKPQGCYSVLAIDPVPPPSERAKAKGLRGNDWEAHYVWGRHNGEYHLLDCDRLVVMSLHGPSLPHSVLLASIVSLESSWTLWRIKRLEVAA